MTKILAVSDATKEGNFYRRSWTVNVFKQEAKGLYHPAVCDVNALPLPLQWRDGKGGGAATLRWTSISSEGAVMP